MSTTEWDRVFLAVTDTFWPEFFHGELNSEDLEKAAAVADLIAPKTDDGAGAPPATGGGLAGEADSTPAPSSPRSFELLRHVDVTGKSGTGVVAEGVQFTDGTAALRWRGANPATAVWPNVEEILAVHGHEGATELVWLDDPVAAAHARVCGCNDETAHQEVHSPEHQEGDTEPEDAADNSDSPSEEG